MAGPFTIEDAAQYGVTPDQLASSAWRHLGPGLYMSAASASDPLSLLRTISHRLPAGAAFSGRTAAWLDGLDLPPCEPIEITIPDYTASSGWRGITIRRRQLSSTELGEAKGLTVTARVRTVADIGRDLEEFDAVAAVDMALHAELIKPPDLIEYLRQNQRGYRSGRLRRVVDLSDGKAESPMESRLRVHLVKHRLPRPELQVPLFDKRGRLLGRADLYYRSHRLVIEYDGGGHRDRLAEDDRRQNALLSAGYGLLRFTAADLLGTPHLTVARVRAALAA